jgi:hypothetical protein
VVDTSAVDGAEHALNLAAQAMSTVLTFTNR